MTTELAINFLLCTNLASAALGFYSWRKWGKWKAIADRRLDINNKLANESNGFFFEVRRLRAEAETRHLKLSAAGKKGRQIQLEKRRAA